MALRSSAPPVWKCHLEHHRAARFALYVTVLRYVNVLWDVGGGGLFCTNVAYQCNIPPSEVQGTHNRIMFLSKECDLLIRFYVAPNQQSAMAGKFGAILQAGMMQIITGNHVDFFEFFVAAQIFNNER